MRAYNYSNNFDACILSYPKRWTNKTSPLYNKPLNMLSIDGQVMKLASSIRWNGYYKMLWYKGWLENSLWEKLFANPFIDIFIIDCYQIFSRMKCNNVHYGFQTNFQFWNPMWQIKRKNVKKVYENVVQFHFPFQGKNWWCW